jgi:FKBP-type peptidyl-prolyl cis-trans isomerase 2
MSKAKIGDRVRIQYSRIRRSARPDAPPPLPQAMKTLEFTVGEESIMRGLSEGVMDMCQGDTKSLSLQPKQAYGDVQTRLIREIPRASLARRLVLKLGMQLTAKDRSSGRKRRVRVIEINKDSILVDGNHPLAGKVVELEVILISVDHSSAANTLRHQMDVGGES